MKRGDNSAYPCAHSMRGGIGLTKRELFAAMALQGFMANKEHAKWFDPDEDAAYVVRIADCLLKALEDNA